MEEYSVLKAFGKKVLKRRADLDLSQEKLAEVAGLDRTYISSVERGQRNISLMNIVKLANALSVSPETFVKGLGDINE